MSINSRVCVLGVSLSETDLHGDIEFCRSAGIPQYGIPAKKLQAAGWSRGVRALKASGLGFGTLLLDRAFTLHDQDRWGEERAQLIRGLETAAELGADSVYVTTGPAGRLDFAAAVNAFTEAVEPVVAVAERYGIPFTVEGLNPLYAHIGFVSTFRDLVTLARASGVGICFDVFPVFQEGGLIAAVREAGNLIQYVQVGDFVPGGAMSVPNRAELGDPDGVIPVRALLEAALSTGYRGAVEIEVLGPRIVQAGEQFALERSARWLGGVLDDLGA